MANSMILILIASIFIPALLALGSAWAYRKWQDRHGRTLPTAGRRIYGPGEQLRKRIDEDTDQMFWAFTVLFFIGPYFVAAWALKRIDVSNIQIDTGDWILAAGMVAIASWAIWRVLTSGKARRIGLAGLKAEMYTAQELNRLVGSGCTVLHDVPGDGFNLDHVVIGPSAVYVVETKSVRKPRNTGRDNHYKVRQEGDALYFPDFNSKAPVQQARHYALWLARYLRDATGHAVLVQAAVSLPGWFVEGPISSDPTAVRVFSPAGRGANFMCEPRGRLLGAAVSDLIVQAILLRYPLTD